MLGNRVKKHHEILKKKRITLSYDVLRSQREKKKKLSLLKKYIKQGHN